MTIIFYLYTPSKIGATLDEHLEAQRLSLNLTQVAVAEKVGISLSIFTRIESN